MIQARCIQKFRDKNDRIYSYRLQDTQGKTVDLAPEQVKYAIQHKQMNVVNLTLTSDNRLVDKSNNQPVNKPGVKTESVITVNKHQPILYKEMLKSIPQHSKLCFELVEALSDNFVQRCKAICEKITFITPNILMLYNKGTVTIVSETPVRILKSRYTTLDSRFEEVNLKNTDLTHLKSMDGVIEPGIRDTLGTNFNLGELKKINNGIVSKYRYTVPNIFDNKRADDALDVAYNICSVSTWLYAGAHPGSGVFDNFVDNAYAFVDNTLTLSELDANEMRDLVLLNWSQNDDNEKAEMDCYFDLAAWGISRMMTSGHFMDEYSAVLDCYWLPVFGALNEKNVGEAIDSELFQDEFDCSNRNEGLDVIKRAIEDYGVDEFKKRLRKIISWFEGAHDTTAVKHFRKSYDYLNRMDIVINGRRQQDQESAKKLAKRVTDQLCEKLKTSIKAEKAVSKDNHTRYMYLTGPLFEVGDLEKALIEGRTNVYTADIGSFAHIIVSIDYFGGQYDRSESFIQLVTNDCSCGDYKPTRLMKNIDRDKIDSIADTFVQLYNKFMDTMDKARDTYNRVRNELPSLIGKYGAKFSYAQVSDYKLMEENIRHSDTEEAPTEILFSTVINEETGGVGALMTVEKGSDTVDRFRLDIDNLERDIENKLSEV